MQIRKSSYRILHFVVPAMSTEASSSLVQSKLGQDCQNNISAKRERSASPKEVVSAQKREASPTIVEAVKLDRVKRSKKEECPNSNQASSSTLDPDTKPQFYFENGFRKVKPYWFKYHCFAKRRWLKRKLIDVFNAEFHPRTSNFFETAIKLGRLRVNGEKITPDYLIKDNDVMSNITHRHELPILNLPIDIIEESDDVLVVNKPCSVPVHACGRYHYNSVTFLLQHLHGYSNLRTLYRLDRTTSGLLLFAKNLAADQRIKRNIMARDVHKVYLAKVVGRFPDESITCEEKIDKLVLSMGIQHVTAKGKESKTTFELLRTDGTTSVVRCIPETGRTHQIRVHLQFLGFPIVNDVIYNSHVFGPQKGKNAEYGKTLEQLTDDLAKEHSHHKWIDEDFTLADQIDIPKVEEGKDYDHLLQSSEIDPFCPECQIVTKEPPIEHSVMYLHCLQYTGPGFIYSVPEPDWAKIDEKEL